MQWLLFKTVALNNCLTWSFYLIAGWPRRCCSRWWRIKDTHTQVKKKRNWRKVQQRCTAPAGARRTRRWRPRFSTSSAVPSLSNRYSASTGSCATCSVSSPLTFRCFIPSSRWAVLSIFFFAFLQKKLDWWNLKNGDIKTDSRFGANIERYHVKEKRECHDNRYTHFCCLISSRAHTVRDTRKRTGFRAAPAVLIRCVSH